MSAITHDMVIKASCSTLFKALTTAQGLRCWFTTEVEGSGEPGTDWILQFAEEPTFDWQIVSVNAEHSVTWKCLQGPGSSPGTEAEFHLEAESDHQCILTIIHRGWAKGDPKFERCIEIWRTLLNHLQQYCETGVATPAYQ